MIIISEEAMATSIWVLRPALFSLFSLSQPMTIPQMDATTILAIRQRICSVVMTNSDISTPPKLFDYLRNPSIPLHFYGRE